MHVGSSFGSDAQPAEVLEPGEGAFHRPADGAQAGAVLYAAAGDEGCDAADTDQSAVLVVVVAAVGGEPAWPATGLADSAADRWDGVEQRDQLSDVVAVAAGERDRERVPWASVIRWCLEPSLRRSTGLGPVWSPL